MQQARIEGMCSNKPSDPLWPVETLRVHPMSLQPADFLKGCSFLIGDMSLILVIVYLHLVSVSVRVSVPLCSNVYIEVEGI